MSGHDPDRAGTICAVVLGLFVIVRLVSILAGSQ